MPPSSGSQIFDTTPGEITGFFRGARRGPIWATLGLPRQLLTDQERLLAEYQGQPCTEAESNASLPSALVQTDYSWGDVLTVRRVWCLSRKPCTNLNAPKH